ncbi:MAG: tryptophan 2,3-dioxygenase [Bradymonadaceae bacterium]
MSDETPRGCPMSGQEGGPAGEDSLTYNSYLKVPELLSLQGVRSEPHAHDEPLFIIIHQAYELWFKLILYELDTVRECMDADDIYEASRLLQRVLQIEKLLVDQIHILETMTPRDFLKFRSVLNPASGFQSIQFREVEFLTGIRDASLMKHIELTSDDYARLTRRLEERSLRTALYELFRRQGFAVEIPGEDGELEADARESTLEALHRLYREPEKFHHLYTLTEALVEHDQNILLWRFHHVRVVERLIGTKKMGTGGSAGVQYLSSTLSRRAYPLLWEVRGRLCDEDVYSSHQAGKA